MIPKKNTVAKLSNDELLLHTKNLISEERRVTLSILHHFREIERRRLFAIRGYASLFEMAVGEFGYSEAAASRRIAAARLLVEVPEVEKKIEDGKLSVTTLSTLQYFFNDQKKQDKPFSAEKKREVINQVENKSKRETEKILASFLDAPIVRRDQVRVVSPTHSEIRFTCDEQLLKKLNRIRALKGHKDLHDYASLFLFMSEIVLDKIDPDRRIQRKETREQNLAKARNQTKIISAADGEAVRQVSQPTKDHVWKRDGGVCTYVDLVTKRRCNSTYSLEYDHIIPKAMNGPDTPENLRLRCRVHNQLHAIQSDGLKKMQRYFATTS